MENTGKTHEENRENTWSPQGKTQGLHNPALTSFYRPVCFGKIKNTKTYTPNENIFMSKQRQW